MSLVQNNEYLTQIMANLGLRVKISKIQFSRKKWSSGDNCLQKGGVRLCRAP